MKTSITYIWLVMAMAAIPLLGGCELCCPKRPPIRPIDKACLPAGNPSAEMPLYRADLDADYEQIAYVDSITQCKDDPDSMSLMMADMKQKGRAAGADAIIRVKVAARETHGFINNPNTPFDSVMQGKVSEYFLRGIAIKYRTPPNGEPAMLPEKHLAGKKKKAKKGGGLGGAIGTISKPSIPTIKTPTY